MHCVQCSILHVPTMERNESFSAEIERLFIDGIQKLMPHPIWAAIFFGSQRELPGKTSVNGQQVAVGRRVRQVVFQHQRSSHYHLKHDVGATPNSVSGPFVFSVTSRLSVYTALPRRNDRSNAQTSGVCELSTLRFASYL